MDIITKLRRARWHFIERRKIKREVNAAALRGKIKVIVGAGSTGYSGWIKTDYPFFNLLNSRHWEYIFSNDKKVDNFLAEHVFEHFTESQIQFILKKAVEFMKKGGCFRIAVPDGFHPDKKYIDYVKPNGSGPGSDDHKVLLNYKCLSDILRNCGLEPRLVEYWNENGDFQGWESEDENGHIMRVMRNQNDSAKKDQRGFFYTSLVIDGIKNKNF
ncbi:class I SAM-dependent methyltransferase [Nafulsella turpanensis]|uniref:hypothetical protein n=1 Tax=Nafulsella turpanensis TaxID=1265690 RepID=UPI0003480333|nr:hypothetical protein [Nafulsella turpanensis]